MNTTDVTWSRLRDLVRRRDKSICFHCNKEDENGACDHLFPVSKGGTDSILNLVWSCKSCNSAKGNRITNDSYIEESLILDLNNEKPKFGNIFRALFISIVRRIIPPYPRINEPNKFWNLEHYRETILLMRRKRITNWIRCQIWTIPSEAKSIIDKLEYEFVSSKNFQHTISWYSKRYPNCPECEEKAISMYGWYDFWVCPNSHLITKEQLEKEETWEDTVKWMAEEKRC